MSLCFRYFIMKIFIKGCWFIFSTDDQITLWRGFARDDDKAERTTLYKLQYINLIQANKIHVDPA